MRVFEWQSNYFVSVNWMYVEYVCLYSTSG